MESDSLKGRDLAMEDGSSCYNVDDWKATTEAVSQAKELSRQQMMIRIKSELFYKGNLLLLNSFTCRFRWNVFHHTL